MRKCTRDCIERFVDCINFMVLWNISELEDRAVAHALCLILEEIEKHPWYDPSRKLKGYLGNGWWEWDYPSFKLSDGVFRCQMALDKLFDFAQSVSELIKHDNVYDIYCNLIALVNEWAKTPPTPTEEEDEDGDDNGF